MQVLFINGSPKHDGTVARLLREIADEITRNGGSVNWINISELSILPCVGCMSCRSTGVCRLPEDDAQRIASLLATSDAIIIGTPCYWGNMPGQLKVLFDRIVYSLIRDNSKGFPYPLHKGKPAAIVATSTTPYPFNILFRQSRGAVRSVKSILKYAGFQVIKSIEKGSTYRHSELTKSEIRKCRYLAKRLCK